MPIKLNGSTSGFTQVNAAAVAASNTLTLPASNGALVAQSTTTAPTNGQIPIGNGTDYTAATITAGAGITVTNGAGSITVALPTPGTAQNYLVSDGTNWTSAAFGASSFGTSGYQKLPNGFIIQWGTSAVAATAGSSATTTFPIAFPTSCQSVVLTPTQASVVTQYSPGVTAKTTTNFTYGSAGSGFASGCFYVAIGY
jgi:hypothetical protein